MIEINLLSPETLRQKKIKNLVFFVIISIFPVILICAILFLPLREVASSAQRELALIKGKVDEYKPVVRQLEQLNSQKAELQDRLNTIKSLVVNSCPWPLVLYGTSKSLPDDIWLTRLAKSIQGKDKIVTIEGFSLNRTAGIGKFVENLNESGLFEEMAISFVSKANIRKVEVMNFAITGKLK